MPASCCCTWGGSCCKKLADAEMSAAWGGAVGVPAFDEAGAPALAAGAGATGGTEGSEDEPASTIVNAS